MRGRWKMRGWWKMRGRWKMRGLRWKMRGRAENVVPNAVSPLTCHVGAQNMSLFGIAPTVANPQPAPPIPQPAPPNPQPTPIRQI